MKPVNKWKAGELTERMRALGFEAEFVGKPIHFREVSCESKPSFRVETLSEADAKKIENALSEIEADGAIIIDTKKTDAFLGWQGSLTLMPYRLLPKAKGESPDLIAKDRNDLPMGFNDRNKNHHHGNEFND